MINYWFGENEYALNKALAEKKKPFSRFDLAELDNPTAEELAIAVKKVPMMGGSVLVVITNPKKLLRSMTEKELKTIPRKCEVVFVGTIKRSKLLSGLKKLGRHLEFKDFDKKQVVAKVKEIANESGVILSKDSVNLFCFLVGNKESSIRNEISKLPKGNVDVNQVNSIVSRHSTANVFSLIEFAIKGDLKRSGALFNRFVDEKTDLDLFVALMIKQVRLLILTKHLVAQRAKKGVVAQELGIHPYRAQLLIAMSRKLSKNQLARLFSELGHLDDKVKITKNPNDIRLFLFRMSKLSR